MLNRSAIVVRHTPAFLGWFKAVGASHEMIHARAEIAEKRVYLIPGCCHPEEIDEVIEDSFEEIFRRELASWLADESLWPDTSDSSIFARFFSIEGYAFVDDLGRTVIEEERP